MAGAKRTDNKGRNLRNGEQQRAEDGLYLYRYTDLSGKRVTKYSSNLAELREKEKVIERDLQDGIDTAQSAKLTLNDIFTRYMNTKDLRESTRCNYVAMWDRLIKNDIGNMKLANLKQIHIREFYAKLMRKNLAEKTIKFCHNMIFPALEVAVDSDYIRKNPAKGCQKYISGTKKKRTALTISEQQVMLDFVKDHSVYKVYYPMLVFAFATGLRIGELTGLRWKDVELKKNLIHIRRQLVYKNYGDGCRFHVQELKTDAGYRDIPLTQNARKALLKQKEMDWLLGKESLEVVDGICDFVFLNTHGKPFPTNAVNFVLDGIVKAYNKAERLHAEKEHREPVLLPHVSAHILRHTACSRLAESGIDAKTLQIIMGHSNVSITLDVYTHLDFSKVQQEMENIEEVINVM